MKKQKEEDSSIKTIEDMIKITRNKNFKYFIYEDSSGYNKLLNSEIGNMVDNSYGIWIGSEYDGQTAFDAQGLDYGSANVTNDVIVLIKDSEYAIVKYPTI